MSVAELSRGMEDWNEREILSWAVDRFGSELAMSSSFQSQSLPLLHIISQVAPQIPVVFLDTGYHFPETLAFRDRLVEEWSLNLKVMRAAVSRDDFIQRHGHDLYRRDPDLCCYVNKVEPMERAMRDVGAWVSGIRRDQSPNRADVAIVERTPQGTVRIHPMANWTGRDVLTYIREHRLPDHPLAAKGYVSIGCAPCTRPVQIGESDRAGRWPGRDRTECGLHTRLRAADDHDGKST